MLSPERPNSFWNTTKHSVDYEKVWEGTELNGHTASSVCVVRFVSCQSCILTVFIFGKSAQDPLFILHNMDRFFTSTYQKQEILFIL